jgi:hypothetical protein
MKQGPFFTGVFVATWLAAASCVDPVHQSEVNALGPEAAGVSPGPTHRPGQPCLTCHGGSGPGDPTFVTAGTVYLNSYTAGTTSYAPLVGGDVHLVDARGLTYDATTNAAGNFYVTTDDWSPTFPLGNTPVDSGIAAQPLDISVAATMGGTDTTPMTTAIERGGVYASCAYCHFDPPGPTSPGHVYQQ